MSDAARLANRVFLAFKDMNCAWAYLEGHRALEDNYPEKNTTEYVDLKEAVLVAAVVAYCRPFKRSKSKDFADPVLEPDRIGLFDAQQELAALHDRILVLRDQVIAHADWTHHSTAVLESSSQSVLRRSPRPQFLGGVTANELRPLVEYVRDYCRNKAFDLDRGS